MYLKFGGIFVSGIFVQVLVRGKILRKEHAKIVA